LPLKRLSPCRLLITRYAQASTRTTLSLSWRGGRDPRAHAAAQMDDPEKAGAQSMRSRSLRQQPCGSGAKPGGPNGPGLPMLRAIREESPRGPTSCLMGK
jgi:hypothetical protein